MKLFPDLTNTNVQCLAMIRIHTQFRSKTSKVTGSRSGAGQAYLLKGFDSWNNQTNDEWHNYG